MDTSRKVLIVSVYVTDVQLFLITIFHLTFEEGRYFCFAPFFFMQVCILSLMTQMNYPTFWLSWHLTQDTHSLHYKEIQKMYFHYKEISMYQNFCVQNSKKKISRTLHAIVPLYLISYTRSLICRESMSNHQIYNARRLVI